MGEPFFVFGCKSLFVRTPVAGIWEQVKHEFEWQLCLESTGHDPAESDELFEQYSYISEQFGASYLIKKRGQEKSNHMTLLITLQQK